MECIICKDNGSEPLQNNTSCTCKYKHHNSCWIDYVHSSSTVKCPLCRKSLTITSTVHISPLMAVSRQNNTLPYRIQPNIYNNRIHNESTESINSNYHRLSENNLSASTVIKVRTENYEETLSIPPSKKERILQAILLILCCALIVIIFVIIIISNQ